MNVHENARLTPHGRADPVRRVLERGLPKTVRKWVARFQAAGPGGPCDRSSRPRDLRQPTPAAVAKRIEMLRRDRRAGRRIAAEAGVSTATVSRVPRRLA